MPAEPCSRGATGTLAPVGLSPPYAIVAAGNRWRAARTPDAVALVILRCVFGGPLVIDAPAVFADHGRASSPVHPNVLVGSLIDARSGAPFPSDRGRPTSAHHLHRGGSERTPKSDDLRLEGGNVLRNP